MLHILSACKKLVPKQSPLHYSTLPCQVAAWERLLCHKAKKIVKNCILHSQRLFFFYALRVTGENFVTLEIKDFLESCIKLVLAAATLAVAAQLHNNRLTAHSALKFPLLVYAESTYKLMQITFCPTISELLT